eukprot:Rhum_TRINITY_DN9384_c0_g1::Rhum_TRINITY_DN9384_c0_g1_i1::g.33163::m.33163
MFRGKSGDASEGWSAAAHDPNIKCKGATDTGALTFKVFAPTSGQPGEQKKMARAHPDSGTWQDVPHFDLRPCLDAEPGAETRMSKQDATACLLEGEWAAFERVEAADALSAATYEGCTSRLLTTDLEDLEKASSASSVGGGGWG